MLRSPPSWPSSTARERAVADALVAADLLAAQTAPAFAHPLVRQAIYEDAPVFRRAQAHRSAARLLDRAGAAADAVAAQLLDAAPEGDAWTVATLRGAAGAAVRRGAPAIAADLLARALDEPPPPDQRSGVRLELAGALGLAGRSGAEEHLAAVLETGREPAERAQAAAALGRRLALAGRSDEAVDLLEGALAEVRGTDPEHERALLAELLSVAQVRPTMRARLGERLQALRTAPLSADTPAGRRLPAMQARRRRERGDAVRALPRAPRRRGPRRRARRAQGEPGGGVRRRADALGDGDLRARLRVLSAPAVVLVHQSDGDPDQFDDFVPSSTPSAAAGRPGPHRGRRRERRHLGFTLRATVTLGALAVRAGTSRRWPPPRAPT